MINCTSIVGGTILFKRTPHRSEFEDQILNIAKKKGLNLKPVLLMTILYPFLLGILDWMFNNNIPASQ